MKSILCYGDSNTWGSATDGRASGRYGPSERWPGVLAQALGEGFHIVEEGLPGRTSVFDDPIEGAFRNGRTYLVPCLLSHRPLDLVIIMLGTNDLKVRFGLSAGEIAFGVGALVDDIYRTKSGRGPAAEGVGPDGATPQVLMVAPAPPTTPGPGLRDMFAGASERAEGMSAAYAAVAKDRGAHFFDAGTIIQASDFDGIHLDVDMHERLGRALAERAAAILG